jgi:hypothetical protein
MEKNVKLIEKPGIYPGIPREQYHGQLTAWPSLSQSFAHDLLFCGCPYEAWFGSYLNPDAVSENKAEFDLGTAGHLIILEPERFDTDTVILDYADYKKDAAKQGRADAWAAGKTPLLTKQLKVVRAMRDALFANKDAVALVQGGAAEETLVARDPVTGVYLKARPDYRLRVNGQVVMTDVKITDPNPVAFANRVGDLGYFMQDPFYRTVHELATGEPVVDFRFLCISPKPPHLVSVNRITLTDFDEGQQCMRAAIDRFAECVATDHWPDYSGKVHDVTQPAYAHYRLADQIGAGIIAARDPSPAVLALARKMQAPTLGSKP